MLSRGRRQRQSSRPRRSRQSAQEPLVFSRRGGARVGAGRPKKPNAGVSHLRKPSLSRHTPVHVTMKLRAQLPNARRPAQFRALRRAFAAGRARFGGRLCHFSVQRDHVHLVVEAEDRKALSRAMQGLAIRMARALNHALGRSGKVFADRFHEHVLRTPTEIKNALRYVLENRWKHGAVDPSYFSEHDYCSSLSWRTTTVVLAQTWLLRTAERRLGLAAP